MFAWKGQLPEAVAAEEAANAALEAASAPKGDGAEERPFLRVMPQPTVCCPVHMLLPSASPLAQECSTRCVIVCLAYHFVTNDTVLRCAPHTTCNAHHTAR
jgi:hypothetical protein